MLSNVAFPCLLSQQGSGRSVAKIWVYKIKSWGRTTRTTPALSRFTLSKFGAGWLRYIWDRVGFVKATTLKYWPYLNIHALKLTNIKQDLCRTYKHAITQLYAHPSHLTSFVSAYSRIAPRSTTPLWRQQTVMRRLLLRRSSRPWLSCERATGKQKRQPMSILSGSRSRYVFFVYIVITPPWTKLTLNSKTPGRLW